MAHVEKRGPNRWRARYRGPDNRERSRTFTTKREADKFIASTEVAKARGEWIEPSLRKRTVGELGEQLLASKSDRNTVAWNRAMLAHVCRRWEHTSLPAVDHIEVQAWVSTLEADGLGFDTVRGAFRVLHEIIALALRGRIINHDPCLGVRLPKVNRREMLYLDASQVETLAKSIEERFPGHGFGTLVRFAAFTGCRAGEIGGLRVRHLDLLRRRVHILEARKTYGEDGDPKTGRARWVDVPRQLCDELASHLACRERGPEARVWTGERGGPLSHRWFYEHRFRPVVAALSAADMLPVSDGKLLRFHDLRHTCAALLIGKGAQQYEVMSHLGHTNIQTTINTYGHLFPNVRERIRTALDEVWDGAQAAV